MVEVLVACTTPAAFCSKKAPAFFCGIGGVGMAGLARLLLQQGIPVSGSERVPNRLTEGLGALGAWIHEGHECTLPSAVEWMVRTPAVRDNNPLLVEARQRGIPVFSRGELLADLANARSGIAVAGTHGKTTTSAMLAHILRRCGIDTGFAVGGETELPGAVADTGNSDLFVFEADESDGSLVGYHPHLGIITNLEWDHVDHFSSQTALHDCFRQFMSQSGRLVLCADDSNLCELAAAYPDVRTAGFSVEATLRVEVVSESEMGLGCRFVFDGRNCGEVLLPFTGTHNGSNAALAILAAETCGVPLADAIQALADFALPARRFDLARCGGRMLVGDYAHHPTEIHALLDAVRPFGHQKLLAIFQPHRFSRTLHLREAFAEVLRGLPDLHLVPTYAASETEMEGGRSADLAEALELPACRVHADLESAWNLVRAEWTEDAALLVIGAGDVVKIFDWANDWLKENSENA